MYMPTLSKDTLGRCTSILGTSLSFCDSLTLSMPQVIPFVDMTVKGWVWYQVGALD